MKPLHWWITLLENKTPAEVVLLTALLVIVAVVVILMVAGSSRMARYTPDLERAIPKDPRPRKAAAPRAAGVKHSRVA